jgi:ABC-type multidrug transport system ATPase subunit
MLRKQAGRKTGQALEFDHVSLSKKGPTLALDIPIGSWVGIAGPSGSGKSYLCDCIAGRQSPSRGSITAFGHVGIPTEAEFSRRDRPQSIAKSVSKDSDPRAITEALTNLGLWDVRQSTIARLSGAQQSAVRLLEPLLNGSEILVIDQSADLFDPWITNSFSRYLRSRLASNLTVVFATNRADFLKMADQLIVLNEEQIAFCGTEVEIRRRYGSTEIVVETTDQQDLRAIVSPFEVKMEPREDGLHLSATEGQSLAARLMLEGYGDVRCIVEREITFEEALRNVILGPI